MITSLEKELKKHADPQNAKNLARFFKTGKGEYGEGDKFLGIKIPVLMSIVKKHLDLTTADIKTLLLSKIHEHRTIALVILKHQFAKAGEKQQKKIVDFYLKHTKSINNWDLVDISAPKILGVWLLNHPEDKKILYQLAKSKNLWEKRIAIMTTFAFIKEKQFDDALKIAMILLCDSHDLIHKAVGWMLREIGKIDQKTEEMFLKQYFKIMPRTMLRYAIEKFNPKKRAFYMKK